MQPMEFATVITLPFLFLSSSVPSGITNRSGETSLFTGSLIFSQQRLMTALPRHNSRSHFFVSDAFDEWQKSRTIWTPPQDTKRLRP